MPFAVVGAAALAVHGVSRSTRDIDLLVMAPECLAPATWAPLERIGVTVAIRPGDADDPLAGVLRASVAGEHPVDMIVGREGWLQGVVDRAVVRTLEGAAVPVATAADLILLKLYAAGSQDAWDIEQLLDGADPDALVARVEAALPELPGESRRLWARIRGLTVE